MPLNTPKAMTVAYSSMFKEWIVLITIPPFLSKHFAAASGSITSFLDRVFSLCAHFSLDNHSCRSKLILMIQKQIILFIDIIL